MINYHLHKPIKLNNVFEIPVDTTKWEYEYNTIKKPWTPKREGKFSFEELLIVKKQTNYLNLVNGHGIYILYFSTLYKFYVGVSAAQSKTPDPILSRLRKHRAKATATNHIKGPTIDHTNYLNNGWWEVAKERYLRFRNNDELSDCILAIITIDQHKKILEKYNGDKRFLENLEYKMGNIFNPVNEYIFQHLKLTGINNWKSFGRKQKGEEHKCNIKTWDNFQFII